MISCVIDSITATIIAIILNIVLSKLLSMFATKNEISPPNGAASLSLKGQFMHMMVHHEQVLFMSSFIVGLVVFLSVFITQLVKSMIS